MEDGEVLRPHPDRPWQPDLPGHQQKAGKRRLSREVIDLLETRLKKLREEVLG